MTDLVSNLNSHGMANLLAGLILAYILLDKVGLIRRPKFLGGNGRRSNGNPAHNSLSSGERQALYHIREGIDTLCDVLCKKDEVGAPLIFKLPRENKYLLERACRGLERIKPGCTVKGGPGI